MFDFVFLLHRLIVDLCLLPSRSIILCFDPVACTRWHCLVTQADCGFVWLFCQVAPVLIIVHSILWQRLNCCFHFFCSLDGDHFTSWLLFLFSYVFVQVHVLCHFYCLPSFIWLRTTIALDKRLVGVEFIFSSLPLVLVAMTINWQFIIIIGFWSNYHFPSLVNMILSFQTSLLLPIFKRRNTITIVSISTNAFLPLCFLFHHSFCTDWLLGNPGNFKPGPHFYIS